MKVRLLTINQKDQLTGRKYDNEQYFNPIQDIDDNWIISNEEIQFCTNKENIEWIDNLPEINYTPPLPLDFNLN